MTHEDYVSFEQAKDLKALGFDWECNRFYNSTLNEDINGWLSFENFNNSDYAISAPTLAQAQKWLREVKGIEVCAHADFEGEFPNGKWLFYFRKLSDNVLDTDYDYEQYNSYEHALSAGIDKSLELIKEENNES